ncbi:salicylate 1-monooxygenase [Ascochyta rabiei]|uniref:Salicylate 1-monooxygenase n=1 Tax=Didymella rabiei TaxID=5454 RepID=A0A163M2H5_DIDRA|nr:salicylate 1-monooxygenase [Ascochyta rabiei]
MPLKVIIVGAGLGGLATAIALTRAGHDVEVYEKSSFHNEVGAAIHLAPNATRILNAWGFNLQKMNPSPCNHLSVWGSQGNLIAKVADTEELQKKLNINDPWLLVHRVDLHNALREKAEEGFGGKKPKIHLSCPVKSVDSSTGKVFLENGKTLQADLIIGADGVHGKSVTHEAKKIISTGQNCFRFLVPTAKLQANPITKKLVDQIGLQSLNSFGDKKRKLVIYPCRSGTLMNMVMFYPEHGDVQVKESSWLNSGNLDDLKEQTQSFSPELRELCSMAEDLKLWSLASRDPLPRFYDGKLALIGDAAHPTLPHQGQGGAQAFEDAAALGALFTSDTKVDDITKKLSLYNDVRYRQAVTLLFMSRVDGPYTDTVMGDLRRFVPDAEKPENIWLFAWNSFPVKDAQRRLQASL